MERVEFDHLGQDTCPHHLWHHPAFMFHNARPAFYILLGLSISKKAFPCKFKTENSQLRIAYSKLFAWIGYPFICTSVTLFFYCLGYLLVLIFSSSFINLHALIFYTCLKLAHFSLDGRHKQGHGPSYHSGFPFHDACLVFLYTPWPLILK